MKTTKVLRPKSLQVYCDSQHNALYSAHIVVCAVVVLLSSLLVVPASSKCVCVCVRVSILMALCASQAVGTTVDSWQVDYSFLKPSGSGGC